MKTPFPGLPRVLLASRSPRRKELLESCGIVFNVLDVEIDESDYPGDMPVMDIAGFLAVEKAKAAIPLSGDAVVIAADSLVICEEHVLGKPENREDAARMLTMLSGRRHTVVTGVCIRNPEKLVAFTEISYVTFATIAGEEIDYYLDLYAPYDKAGAYAIQEWIGRCKITRIEGSYTNIMGLPTERVYRALKEWKES